MGESKGGHSAKEDSEEDYKKHMIDIEGCSIDYRTIIDIESGYKANSESEDGMEYNITIIRNTYPGEKVFRFLSMEARDVALTKLRAKMSMLNTIFH